MTAGSLSSAAATASGFGRTSTTEPGDLVGGRGGIEQVDGHAVDRDRLAL